jgi:hypothetical protein
MFWYWLHWTGVISDDMPLANAWFNTVTQRRMPLDRGEPAWQNSATQGGE